MGDPGAPAAGAPAPVYRPGRRGRWIGRAPVAVVGGVIVAAYVAAAVLAPVLSPADPLEMQARALLAAPGGGHPLGTDQFGRDVLSRLLHGARTSLAVACASVALALAGGGTVGILAGYYGGLVDETLMRLVDVLLAFPGGVAGLLGLAYAWRRRKRRIA